MNVAFFKLLAMLLPVALSTADGTDRLCRMVRKMLGIHGEILSPHNFRISPWDTKENILRCLHLLLPEPDKENKILADVYDLLVSTQNAWQGDIILRLQTIVDLHDTFTVFGRHKSMFPVHLAAGCANEVNFRHDGRDPQEVYANTLEAFRNKGYEHLDVLEKSACPTLIHWLLVAASSPDRKKWTKRPDDNAGQDCIYLRLVECFRNYSLGKFDYDSMLMDPKLQLCCDCIISEKIRGLPKRFLHELARIARCLALADGQQDLVNKEMDKLFRHFLHQSLEDSEIDPDISITQKDQQNTLDRLVDIIALAIYESPDLEAYWKGLLEGWAGLVEEMLCRSENSAAYGSGVGVDLKNLQDVIQEVINRPPTSPEPPKSAHEEDGENDGDAPETGTFVHWLERRRGTIDISAELACHLSPDSDVINRQLKSGKFQLRY
jgi:hypothetical protein